MITTTLLALSAPLFLSPPQVGQDYVLRQAEDYSADVITLREDPNTAMPMGFATLEITRSETVGGTGDFDMLLIRMDEDYNVLWKRQFGGSNDDFGRKIVQTKDGGILVSAYSLSTPVTTFRAVLVKFDGAGNMMWARCYPGEQWGNTQGTTHTELSNQNIMLVSGITGLGVSGSFDGIHILTDPNGAPLSWWRYDVTLGWNLPSRIIYRAITSVGKDSAACGVIHHVQADGSVSVNSFVHRFPDVPGTGLAWINEYPVYDGPDRATGIAWTADDNLVVCGALGPFSSPPTDGFGFHTHAVDGSMAGIGLGLIYPDLVLNDVIEDIDPSTDPTTGSLCFAGYLLRAPDVTGLIGFDASLMLTDPYGYPMRNMYYDPDPWGAAVSVTNYYTAYGFSNSGYFGLGTSFSSDYVAAPHQHWIHTDLSDIKTGCLEDEYGLWPAKVPIDPMMVPVGIFSMDGVVDLDWDVIDPDLEVVDICEDDPDPYPSICFGDGTGTPCPCGNSGGTGEGCANSTGLGAILSASGDASVSADTLVVSISQGKPSQPVLFFQGMNFINSGNGNPFGDGLRCCGSGVRRLQVRFMDASGSASTTATLSVAGAVTAGTTYCNQGWYRDPLVAGGSPCANYFNLSNALSITWTP